MDGSKRLRGCHTSTNRISDYNVCVEGTVELCTIPQRSSAESAYAFLMRQLTRAARRPHSESDEQRTDAMTARDIHWDTEGGRQGRYV